MADFPDSVEAPLRARFVSLGVRPEEVEERFVRGAGAGGQKINKTSSTVWLRHGPTGIEVRCQRERSQTVNRLLAWTELADKLAWRRAEAANQAQAARELVRRQKRQKIPRAESADDRDQETPREDQVEAPGRFRGLIGGTGVISGKTQ